MRREHRIKTGALVPLLALGLALPGCSASTTTGTTSASTPGTTSATTPVTAASTTPATASSNLFPLQPGTEFVYNGTVIDAEGSHTHRNIFTVTDLVKPIDGQLAVVAWDQDFQDGQLAEAELAMFVQDANGDVRTMAEYPEEYENGKFSKAPSVWVSGLASAQAGILVPGNPKAGTPPFTQGRAPKVNFYDVGRVFRGGVRLCTPAGCFDQVTVIQEWNPLAPEDGKQLKYYAPGVGVVRISAEGGGSQENMTLTRVRTLGPDAIAVARKAALRLDRRGSDLNAVWAKTSPAYLR